MPVLLLESFFPAFGEPWHIENMQGQEGAMQSLVQATFLDIRSPGPLLLLGMGDFSEIPSAFRQE